MAPAGMRVDKKGRIQAPPSVRRSLRRNRAPPARCAPPPVLFISCEAATQRPGAQRYKYGKTPAQAIATTCWSKNALVDPQQHLQ